MRRKFFSLLFTPVMALVAVMPAMAQRDYEESVTEEPRARKGGYVRLEFRDIPSEDKANVDGPYQVSNDDGTIMLPYLANRVRVVGMTARQLGDHVRKLYQEQKIYTRPIVMARVGSEDETLQLMTRRITVSGNVNAKKVVVYRPGITLIQVLMECGDISVHGSRNIQVTRKGVTRTYDYFSAGDRSIKLLPNDQVFVPERGPWEGRPSKLLP